MEKRERQTGRMTYSGFLTGPATDPPGEYKACDFREGRSDSDKRCSVCVLPRTAKNLTFDAEGVCSLCRADLGSGNRDSRTPRGIQSETERMRELGRGRQYDCLVGLSGGRDSSYLLYLLVRKHKLRCLAAYYRTPFTNDTIHENVKTVVARLDVPLVEMGLSQEFHRVFAARVFDILMKTRLPELVHLLCAPCKFINKALLQIARKHDVKSVVCAGGKDETFQFGATVTPRTLGKHELYFGAQARKGLSALGRGILLVSRHPRLISCVPTGLRSILFLNPHTAYLRVRYPGIRRVDYFYHEQYDEEACTRTITSELGWMLPPGCNSYWRADCSMAEVKNLLFRRLIGVSYVDANLSNKVRSGDISRDEALTRLKTEGRISEYRLHHVARVLGLSSDVFKPFFPEAKSDSTNPL